MDKDSQAITAPHTNRPSDDKPAAEHDAPEDGKADAGPKKKSRGTEKKLRIPKLRISDTLILALLSGLAYLLSYQMEVGELEAFGIPLSFAGFGNRTIIHSGLVEILFATLFGVLISFLIVQFLWLAVLCSAVIIAEWARSSYVSDSHSVLSNLLQMAAIAALAALITAVIRRCVTYSGKSTTKRDASIVIGSLIVTLLLALSLMYSVKQSANARAKGQKTVPIAMLKDETDKAAESRPALVFSRTAPADTVVFTPNADTAYVRYTKKPMYMVIQTNSSSALCVEVNSRLKSERSIRVYELKDLKIEIMTKPESE